MDIVDSAKIFLKKKQKYIRPTFNFARKSIEHATKMREKSNIVDWINLSLLVKDEWSNTLGNIKGNDHFEFLTAQHYDQINTRLGMILGLWYQTFYYDDFRLIKSFDKVRIFSFKKDNHHCYFVQNSEQGISSFQCWVEESKLESIKTYLVNLFWENIFFFDKDDLYKYASHISFYENNDNFSCSKSYRVPSNIDNQTHKYIEYIEKYFGKECHSILFYGPPGTGKSTLIDNIAIHFCKNKKRVAYIGSNDINPAFAYLASDLGIELIITHDVDHALSSSSIKPIDSFLSGLDRLHEYNIPVLATINKAGNLDPSIIRPGRFDEAVEISRLPWENVLETFSGDELLARMVANMPIGFINEFKKRVKILGKEEAVTKFADLKIRFENYSIHNYGLDQVKPDVTGPNVTGGYPALKQNLTQKEAQYVES